MRYLFPIVGYTSLSLFAGCASTASQSPVSLRPEMVSADPSGGSVAAESDHVVSNTPSANAARPDDAIPAISLVSLEASDDAEDRAFPDKGTIDADTSDRDAIDRDGETADENDTNSDDTNSDDAKGDDAEDDDDTVERLIPDDPAAPRDDAIQLGDVVESVHQSYPLLRVVMLEAQIANGNQLAAWGAFDTKFKASSENGPTGFYQTYRHGTGFEQPLYHGGEVFGGYRIGRGDFQPWYLERQTNDGGEFKTGIRVPFLRNREIDARRAELWRSTYERQRVRPEIRAQLIYFVRDGSVAYWNWIAAGRRYDIGERALELSQRRNEQLDRKVRVGDLDPPVLQDNLRSIAQRKAKLIDRGRKLQQSAIKLSLFLRAEDGMPFVPDPELLAEFDEPTEIVEEQLETDIEIALEQRPEIAALDALYRRINVDLAEARNDFLPSVDGQLAGSQDVGEPTSSKRDKSEFELEAGLFVDVPLQRRKALGKCAAAQAKLQQVAVKRRFTQDKIVAEVRSAFAALRAAWERIGAAREARRLAEYMADVERRKFELGESDLLAVFLREQYAIEAADGEVDALLEYFVARADYLAAQAFDRP